MLTWSVFSTKLSAFQIIWPILHFQTNQTYSFSLICQLCIKILSTQVQTQLYNRHLDWPRSIPPNRSQPGDKPQHDADYSDQKNWASLSFSRRRSLQLLTDCWNTGGLTFRRSSRFGGKPVQMVGFVIINRQSSPLAELFVFVDGNKW